MNEKEKRKISKSLSLVLRHAPETIGLELDENGWAQTAAILSKYQTRFPGFSIEMLREVVQTNDKQRFAFNEDETKIRANQGHSLKTVDINLEAKEPPHIVYHGTAERNVDSITKNGIDKRSRQHVHLSADKETAHKVGSRHGAPIILKIDSYKMSQDGLVFFQSANGVWLTDFIDPKYIKQ